MRVNYYLRLIKLKNWEIVFTVALIFYVLSGMLMSTLYGAFGLPESFRLVRFGVTIILLACCIYIKGTLRNVFSIAFIGAIIVMTILFSGSIREMLLLLVFFIAAEDANFKDIFKLLCVAMTIMMLVVIICDSLGAFEQYYTLVEDIDRTVDGEKVTRAYLGFDYTTMGPSLFISIIFLDGYANKDRAMSINELLKYGVILIINKLLKDLTDTRAVYLCVLMYIAGLIIIKLVGQRMIRNRLIKFGVMMAFPVMILTTIYFGMIYSPESEFLVKLNTKLSGRLRLTKAAIDEFGVHLFGSKFEWRLYGYRGTRDYMFVDSSYWNIIIKNGVIMFLLVTAMLLIIMKFTIDKKEMVTAWIFIIIGVRAMIDPQLLNIMFTPFILIFGNAISYYYRHADILSIFRTRKQENTC